MMEIYFGRAFLRKEKSVMENFILRVKPGNWVAFTAGELIGGLIKFCFGPGGSLLIIPSKNLIKKNYYQMETEPPRLIQPIALTPNLKSSQPYDSSPLIYNHS